MEASNIRVLKQDYHRNGVGGNGFVVSLFEWDTDDVDDDKRFVGISFGSSREEFIFNTAVLHLGQLQDGNIEFARGNSWRGSDHCGPALADAWNEFDPEE